MPNSKAAKWVKITGIIGPGYPGLSHSPPQRHWNLRIPFVAWKSGDSTVRREPLLSTKAGGEKALEKIYGTLRTLDVVRLTASEPALNPYGELHCELIKFHGPASDSDLAEVVAEFRKAVTIEDDWLGPLVLDRALGMYSGEIDWCGTRVELMVDADQERAARKCLGMMHLMVAAQKDWKKRIEDFAVAELLALKNENWREDDEPKIAGREFRKRMTLRTISIRTNGRFELWYEDGDLFYGHSIVVAGDLKNGPRKADIAG